MPNPILTGDPAAPLLPEAAAASACRLPELLAPAGDWECARAAVENGADAIYFGLDRFNARMRARNFTEADLPDLMAYLHRRGVKGYVTFNTLVFQEELAGAEQYLRSLITAGVDAAIVQDVGIARLIRRLSPDFPIHASTQMTVTSAAGVEFARRLGCNLVVLARECSLKEIGKIREAQAACSNQYSVFSIRSETGARAPTDANSLTTDSLTTDSLTTDSLTADSLTTDSQSTPPPLPLEVFVHGALCVAYSGQCLTSEALGGRSANRGECAQACRMPYELLRDGQPVPLGDRRYLLSPQDLSGLDVLPELVRAGVASLKIEGRLKSPEYVASITRVYRQALDRLGAGRARTGATLPPAAGSARNPELQPGTREEAYELEMAFSRGLFTGWFGGIDNQRLVHARFGKKRGVFLGEVTRVQHGRVFVRLQGPLQPGDGIVFDAGRPDEQEEGGRVYEVRQAEGGRQQDPESVLGFGQGDIDFSRVHPGDRIWKTSDPELDRRLRRSFEGDTPKFQRPVHAEVHGRAGLPLTLLLRDDEGHLARRDSTAPLMAAEKRPLDDPRLREQLGRLGGTPFRLGRMENRLEGAVILPVSELNRLRRDAVAELERQRAQPKRWTLVSPGVANSICELPPAGAHLATATIFNSLSPARSGGAGRGEGEIPLSEAPPLPSPLLHRMEEREQACSVFMAVSGCAPPAAAGPDVGARDPELIALVRSLPQLDAVLTFGLATVYCDFEDPKKYRDAVARVRAWNLAGEARNTAIWVAPPRIFKPGEEWILKQVRSSEADGYLVRNYDHLEFFKDSRRLGDFSLNVANAPAAGYFRNTFGLERVTASCDLDATQLEALLRAAPPDWFEIILHQHMPMFHMEHCVFCAFLTQGTDFTNCGRPCDRHEVRLRDRVGAEHVLKADLGCRNTVFNARAQTGAEHAARLLVLGARHFRVEFVDESPEQVTATLTHYARLLRGEITGTQVWRELKLINQLGVTRGTMARRPETPA